MRLRQAGRAEHDVVVAGEAVDPVQGGADRVAHGAAGAVGAHQIVALNRKRRAALEVAHLRADTARLLRERDQLGLEPQVDGRKLRHVGAEHLLERVLRHPLRVLGIERALGRRAVERVLEPRQRMTAQPRREHDVRGIVDAERRGLAQVVRNAPAPQMLARAHVGGLGSRRVADPVVALDHQARDPAAPELDGKRKSGRPGPHDQHLRAQ